MCFSSYDYQKNDKVTYKYFKYKCGKKKNAGLEFRLKRRLVNKLSLRTTKT